jgi:DNA-binding response OmpR family regulator
MIEDDARLAQMVSDYLAQSGFAVTHAPDGERRAWSSCRWSSPNWSSWT